MAVDGEEVILTEHESLKQLVESAHRLQRLESRFTQIFILRGNRFHIEHGPLKRLILSKKHKIPLIPPDRRDDEAPDASGAFISPYQYQADRLAREIRQEMGKTTLIPADPETPATAD